MTAIVTIALEEETKAKLADRAKSLHRDMTKHVRALIEEDLSQSPFGFSELQTKQNSTK